MVEETVDTLNNKISELESELSEKNKQIADIIATRGNSKIIYGVGFVSYTIILIAGIYTKNLMWIIASLCLVAVSITAIIEAKLNGW